MTINGLMKLNKYSLVKIIKELQDQIDALVSIKDKLLEENEKLKEKIKNE